MYKLNHIEPIESFSKLEKGTFILIMHPEKTPPHIALLVDGLFYSSGVGGVKNGEALSVFWKLVTVKHTPIIFVNIKEESNKNILNKIFETNYIEENNLTTCLSNVKSYFGESKGIDVSTIALVFDLLDSLKKDIINVYSVNLVLDKDNSFSIKKYTLKDVYERINTLKLQNA